MKNFDEIKFLNDLLSQHWEYVYFFCNDPNDMWEIWKELFLEVFDKHAPLQQKKVRSSKIPWITSKIKNLINTRDKLKLLVRSLVYYVDCQAKKQLELIRFHAKLLRLLHLPLQIH